MDFRWKFRSNQQAGLHVLSKLDGVHDIQTVLVFDSVVANLFATAAMLAIFFAGPATETVTILMKFSGAVVDLEVESLEHCQPPEQLLFRVTKDLEPT